MDTSGALGLEGGAAGGAALQLITQALAQLQESKREMEAKIQRLEGEVETLKRRLSLYEERGGDGGGAGQGPVELLQGRMAALEVSLKRALESVFPRVSRLVDHLEARPVPESHPSPTVSSAASVPAAASASSASTSTCAPVSSQLSASQQQPHTTTSTDISSLFSVYEPTSAPFSNSSAASEPQSRIPNARRPTDDPARRRSLGEKLLSAAREKNFNEVERLLNDGVDPSYASGGGDTALMLVSFYGHSPTVSLLLRSGADVNATRFDGWTALHSTTSNERSGRVVPLLVAAGARVDQRSNDGRTPLHVAAEENNVAAVCALLAAGASTTLTDHAGKTPLDLARSDAVRCLLCP